MKKVLLILSIVVLHVLAVRAESPVDIAKSVVKEAYSQLETVSTNGNQDIDAYARLKRAFSALFPHDDFFLPDEFSFMEDGTAKIGIRTANYFKDFSNLSESFQFSYRILSDARCIYPREFNKKDVQADFVNLYVSKSYAFQGKTISFIDTLCVNVAARKIVKFENTARIHNENTFNISIETMRAEAALLCQQDRVKEGYELYKKIVSKASDADSYYRMAVLVYDKGSRNDIGIDKKTAMRLTMEYLNKALEYYNKDYRLKSKVQFMQYWVS